MEPDRQMPSALTVARTLSSILAEKLSDCDAASIVLERDEAALCLGVINGIVESLEREARPAS
ncbi:MAG: hypothetical protein C0409_14335 [Novosphingobium sp.]|nr:hypothetical protein [Novosphingobium sp.]